MLQDHYLALKNKVHKMHSVKTKVKFYTVLVIGVIRTAVSHLCHNRYLNVSGNAWICEVLSHLALQIRIQASSQYFGIVKIPQEQNA